MAPNAARAVTVIMNWRIAASPFGLLCPLSSSQLSTENKLTLGAIANPDYSSAVDNLRRL
jgi:hypothetical protein